MKALLLVSRSGIALPAAVVTLAIASLFIAGSAFFTLQEVRAGRNSLTDRAALEAAEYGAVALARDWRPELALVTPIGATLGPHSFSLAGGASATARLSRATATTFWAVSEARAGLPTSRNESRRTVSVIYRIALALPDLRAALTVRDSGRVVGGGVVSGSDSLVSGPAVLASCSGLGAGVAGVAAPDTTRVCDGTCGATSGQIRGAPPLVSQPAAIDTQHYRSLGDRTWAALAAGADAVFPPNAVVTPAASVVSGVCQRAVATNWGDPSRTTACADFFPVIWAQGDVTVNGGQGQGILIADGDVRLGAGARFSGLVIARDDIVTMAGGGSIIGAAMAEDARTGAADHTVIGAGGLVQHSACALQSAVYGSAPLIRVRHRAWAEF